MATAFQRNAFQNNAFQIRTAGDIGGAIVVHRSGTPFTKKRYRKLIEEIEAEARPSARRRARGGAGKGSGAQGRGRGQGAAEGRA